MIRAIVAMDDQRGIARGGAIPWNIQTDLKYFREMTEGHSVVMGYATYGRLAKPLRNRRNYVWCREGTVLRDGFTAVYDLRTFLLEATVDMWVMGGEATYREAFLTCGELYITFVRGDFSCDQFFPRYEDQFACISRSAGPQDTTPGFDWSVWRRTTG